VDIVAELVRVGVDPAHAAELARAHHTRPPGVLDPEDAAPASTSELLLQIALVAIRQVFKYAATVRIALDRLQESTELTSYDSGRAWHCRSVLAWRVDKLPFDASRALNESLKVLAADDSARAQRYRARVHDTLGQLLHQQGMTSDALRELKAALALRDLGSDKFGAAITVGNLGRLHLDLGDFTTAADYLARDLAIVDEIAPELLSLRAQLLSHIGECHVQMGAVDEAERLFAKSAAVAEQSGDVAAICFAQLGLGRVHNTRADTTQALEIAAATLARVDGVALHAEAVASVRASACLLLADAYLQRHRFDDAIENFQLCLAELGRTAGASPMEYAQAYRGLSTALAAKQRHSESARSLRLALRHLDGTAAEALRLEVEHELQTTARDSWLLHAAGRFLGQTKIEHLLMEAGRVGFRGSKQKVAVLFSDIRGFTTLSEQLDPEELVSLLNEYLGHMTRCIDLHGGTVDKFIGDAVMAVFSTEEGADRTGVIAAAVAMHEELERFNRYVGAGRPELQMGIGIHAGSVVSGLIGSAQKREVTVIGDVVNTASRLESMTKRFGAKILVTGDVLTEADRQRYLLRTLGRVTPRGRRGGIEIFEVLGLRDRTPRSRQIAAEIERATRALTALTKRQFLEAADELADLERASAGTSRAKAYGLLAAGARQLLAEPPPEEWSGELVVGD